MHYIASVENQGNVCSRSFCHFSGNSMVICDSLNGSFEPKYRSRSNHYFLFNCAFKQFLYDVYCFYWRVTKLTRDKIDIENSRKMYKCQERVFRRGLSTSGRILPIVRYFGKLHSMGQLGIRKKVFLAKTQTNISIFFYQLSIYQLTFFKPNWCL